MEPYAIVAALIGASTLWHAPVDRRETIAERTKRWISLREYLASQWGGNLGQTPRTSRVLAAREAAILHYTDAVRILLNEEGV